MANVPVNSLVAAAFAALIAGAPLASCATEKNQSHANSVSSAAHACKGMNTCRGNGGCSSGNNKCAGKNSCKGMGGCATTDKHACKGMNNCHGQGGCSTGDHSCAGKNSCKGKGGCAVPVKPH